MSGMGKRTAQTGPGLGQKWLTILCVTFIGVLLVSCTPQAAVEPPAVETPAKETAVVQEIPPTTEAIATAVPAPATPASTLNVKRGGTLRDQIEVAIDTLDPQLTVVGGAALWDLMFDSLLQYEWVGEGENARIEVVPGLAESYEVLEPTVIEFKLRKGVKFQDGTDFNAKVAKWNIDRVMNAEVSKVKTTLATVEEAVAVDDYTLRLNLTAPSPSLPLMLTPASPNCLFFVSQAAVESAGDEKFGVSPVGSGPMKLKEWIRDDRVILERFPDYWGMGEDGMPLPYFDSYEAVFVSDQAVGLTQLRTGNLDILITPGLSNLQVVQSDPNLAVTYQTGKWTAQPSLYFNPNPESGSPFSKIKELRYAAEYATDREAAAKALGFGIGEPQYYWGVFPGMEGYDESLPKREYDLEKAKQLVIDAGYPDGVEVTVKVINRTSDTQPVELLQAMWAKAGIKLNIELQDRLVWIDDGRSGNFEALSHGNGSEVTPLLRQQTRTGANHNWAGYSDEQMDEWWVQAESEYDPAKREEILKKMQVKMYEEAYWLSAYRNPAPTAHNKRVNGLTTTYQRREVWLDK